MMNVLAGEMLRKYVPNFVANFVDNGLVDIIAVENAGDYFIVFSHDNQCHQCFMVGEIGKEDEEDNCFDDQHRCFDVYNEARKAYMDLVEKKK